MNKLVILALLLAGCASAPVRKPVPPPPPLPPVIIRVQTPRRVPMNPPMPPPPPQHTNSIRSFAFTPASVEPVPDPLIGIYPFGTGYYMVVALQRAGGTLEMQFCDTLGGPWTFLAGYGYSFETQYVSAVVPDNWLPYRRMFIKAINTPQPPPGAMLAKGAPEVYTDKWIKVKGTNYRLVRISPVEAQFPMYKLVK